MITTPIKGASNPHAAVAALEYTRRVAGLKHVEPDPWPMYADLCGGVDAPTDDPTDKDNPPEVKP